jgi:hypothetical protein
LWGFSGFVSSVSWKNDLQTYCKLLTLVLGCLVRFPTFWLEFHFCPQVKQQKRDCLLLPVLSFFLSKTTILSLSLHFLLLRGRCFPKR